MRLIAGTSNLFITCDGEVLQRVNVSHPERRQWLTRKLEVDKDGYLRVRIQGKNRTVHRLVYTTYVGVVPVGHVIRHVDGNPANNTVNNLTTGTQAENIADKLQHGTHQAGELHPRATITTVQAANVRQALRYAKRSRTGRIARGEHIRISAETGVSIHVVRDIHSKGTWACVV